jgi:hypothetical protein
MSKKTALGALIFLSASAFANSWDSRSNILNATNNAVFIYKAKGIDGLVGAAQSCYDGLDSSMRNKYVGRDTEYCIALEVAANQIDQKTSGSDTHPYFKDTLVRVMLYLEKGRIVTLPEQFGPYASRFSIIKAEIAGRL